MDSMLGRPNFSNTSVSGDMGLSSNIKYTYTACTQPPSHRFTFNQSHPNTHTHPNTPYTHTHIYIYIYNKQEFSHIFIFCFHFSKHTFLWLENRKKERKKEKKKKRVLCPCIYLPNRTGTDRILHEVHFQVKSTVFFFFETGCLTDTKKASLIDYFPQLFGLFRN